MRSVLRRSEGWGRDQVLVLVNGKRRHGSALIHVNTSVGRGTAGVDMNAIPASAIKRIEVLRDGASAAVRGQTRSLVSSTLCSKMTTKGDSVPLTVLLTRAMAAHSYWVLTTVLSSAKMAFFMGRFEYRDRQSTNRAGLTGVIQYPGTEVGKTTPVQIMNDPGNKEHNFDRQNFRIGDAESRQTALVSELG